MLFIVEVAQRRKTVPGSLAQRLQIQNTLIKTYTQWLNLEEENCYNIWIKHQLKANTFIFFPPNACLEKFSKTRKCCLSD